MIEYQQSHAKPSMIYVLAASKMSSFTLVISLHLMTSNEDVRLTFSDSSWIRHNSSTMRLHCVYGNEQNKKLYLFCEWATHELEGRQRVPALV